MPTCSACGASLPAGARFCPSCGREQQESTAPTEERKLATVLFADLVGSTARASEEDPERVRARLDRFYAAMAEEIERTGGTVEKFAGDSVMAAFGAPSALEDHAERALHAALAMQRRLAEAFEDGLRLRIGVNTGDVVVGQAREGSSFVTGDSVNVGARLEQAAAPGEILAGERTVAAAQGAFEFGEGRLVEAKGKSGGVLCRPVLRALTLARPRGVGGFRRVFVGRETELELLRATLRRAVSQREPHLVTIVGEPGVGKTTLVRELWEMLATEEPAPLRRTGRCLPYGDGITYWPIGEVLKEHFGILESDPPEVVKRRLEGREILGLALGLDVAGGLHPLDARERLHETVVRFVEELAAERPVVKLVEDIHWAEEDLLDLLERVARDARAPIVLLTTARPELLDRRPMWGAGRRNATTIWLEPLADDATSRMLDELLAVEVPSQLRDLVVLKAEGNPFFVEELLGTLVDTGVIERRNGSWAVARSPEEFTVPDTVHAVLAARIDRLPPTEKAALQAASVVGRIFWHGPVVHLLDGDEPDLELLEERDFVRRRAGSSMAGEREYAIKHALTREVAYGSISKARRGRLHAAFAEWVERWAGAKDEQASLLAYHYSEAVRTEDVDLVWGDDPVELQRLRSRAVTWLRRAGELAQGRYEMEEAIELLTRAVEYCADEHERALLWREIGLAHALRFDGEGFWAAMQRALDGPLTRAEEADVYSLLAFHTSIRSGMWTVRPDPNNTRSWADAALERAEPESGARVRALLARVNVDPITHAADARTAGALAERIGDITLRSYALAARAVSAFAEGRFGDAETLIERRLELIPELGDPDVVSEAYETAVPTVTLLGRLHEAHRLAAQHQEVSGWFSPHHRMHGIALSCEIDEAAGYWEAIAARTASVEEAVAANVATPCIRNARCLLLTAIAHLALGDEVRARELERRAAELEGAGFQDTLAPPRLRLALLRGDATDVRRLLEIQGSRMFVFGPGVVGPRLDALAAVRDRDRIEQEAPPLARRGLLVEPFALRALAVAREDDDLLAEAQRRFDALGLAWHAAQTERLVAGF